MSDDIPPTIRERTPLRIKGHLFVIVQNIKISKRQKKCVTDFDTLFLTWKTAHPLLPEPPAY